MNDSTIFGAVIAFICVLTVFKGIKIVPQQQAWVIETLGKFTSVLSPGLNIIIPYVQRVSYKHSLKEDAIDVQQQTAITKDNVTLSIDGVLYLKIVDPINASYGVSDPYYAISQLAQTTMRSEIGKITLDKTFEEREALNVNIVRAINEAANAWGIQCMRYEIKDITPPASVLEAMELEVAAERQKRAEILESEGKRDAEINRAQGDKKAIVLASEANMTEQVNLAKGEAEAILSVATATAEGISKISKSITTEGGNEAVSFKIAEQYVEAFKQLAKEGTTILLPANSNDIGSMVAQAMTIYNKASALKNIKKDEYKKESSKEKRDIEISPSPWEED
ncbi:paraslipin [Rickettsiales bacterium]|nr:paraslipin [Rickettsiales bacterium]